MKKFKINFINYYLFSVPVNFDISWLKILASNHLIVVLECEGKKGIGEGVLYRTSPLKSLDLLDKEFHEFFKQDFLSLRKAREELFKQFYYTPGIVCAFDLALWDLEGKIKKEPTFEILGKKKRDEIPIAEQIFIPESKISLTIQVKKIMNKKTKFIKLKAGRNLRQDIENINLTKKVSGNKVQIQLDLNQALNFDQALWFGKKIRSLGVLTWEEPTKFNLFSQLNKLKRKTGLPIILDESIRNIEDLREAINAKAIDILNLKISRLGGITNSIQLIKLAKKNRIEIEIGCSEELGLATNAQLHLGSSMSNLRLMEALGSDRLGFDIIKAKQVIKNGYLKTPSEKHGLGTDFDFSRLNRAGRKFGFSIVDRHNPKIPSDFYINYFKTRMQNKFLNGKLWLEKKVYDLRPKKL
ncbi:MAG TPA: mandelate racemase/muconate lactonizing enzyme family protein [Candidatus Paceibacterota bacterium]|nr:mandelate racemase/muconate lactonizing enzyme family protein [Candidatus Paceibacterota bacterium]